jgi:hypothetical protein
MKPKARMARWDRSTRQLLLLEHLMERAPIKVMRPRRTTQSGTRTTTIVVGTFNPPHEREADIASHQLHASLQWQTDDTRVSPLYSLSLRRC